MMDNESTSESTLEILNIERNILWELCNKRGIKITSERLREMARQELNRKPSDHPYDGDPEDIRFSVEKYDE